LKRRKACSKARTAASVPGDGGFFGGAGSGFGASAVRRANIAFRACAFDTALFLDKLALGTALVADFLASAIFRAFEGATRFLGAAFLTARLVDFLAAAACLPFLPTGGFLPAADFFADLGAAVIFPGRFGFLAGAFFAFARMFWDFEKPLLVALVIKLLINILEVENQLAFRITPARTPVYVCFISIIYRQVKKIPRLRANQLPAKTTHMKLGLASPKLIKLITRFEPEFLTAATPILCIKETLVQLLLHLTNLSHWFLPPL